MQDKQAQIESLQKEMKGLHEHYKSQIGEKVQAKVTLIKDYGNIVTVDKYPQVTGFILTEQLVPKKTYKEGQVLNCVVLDIDFEK